MQLRPLVLLIVLPVVTCAQQPVEIEVTPAVKKQAFTPVWNYFGYDEPNFTYAPNGEKLIGELAALSQEPVHIRTHFLLATGNGIGALKWGSTNAYTEDSAGKPVYDWAITDKILGTYVQAGATPFVEVGFMPEALSTHPEPYTPVWKPHGRSEDYNLGWSYPPKDYGRWSELIYQWVEHCVKKYGRSAAETWYWEVWNEPDIGYWHGTPEEYDKLYDYTAAAIKRALPSARVGGPASTGPANVKAAAFLKQFLAHCSSGANTVTGRKGAPLDFISYHAKGRPEVLEGHVRMGLSQELKDASEGFDIVRSFPQFRDLPIILSEADPEGCAACSARVYPPNAYRNGTLYAAYEAVAMKAMLELAATNNSNLEGILTWAFEFENQPYFDGFRTLSTNGIDKPVLNFFRMAGLMRGNLMQAKSSGGVPTRTILDGGVRHGRDIDALAVHNDGMVTVLVWNYQDEDVDGPSSDIKLRVAGFPVTAKRILMQQYRLDRNHSNSYTAWKRMGSPQNPSSAQYSELERAGQLQTLESPRWIKSLHGEVEVNFSLPLQSLSLLELSW